MGCRVASYTLPYPLMTFDTVAGEVPANCAISATFNRRAPLRSDELPVIRSPFLCAIEPTDHHNSDAGEKRMALAPQALPHRRQQFQRSITRSPLYTDSTE